MINLITLKLKCKIFDSWSIKFKKDDDFTLKNNVTRERLGGVLKLIAFYFGSEVIVSYGTSVNNCEIIKGFWKNNVYGFMSSFINSYNKIPVI